MPQQLIIHLGLAQECQLTFDIEQSPIADLWLQRMEKRVQWSMDDARRFYGFNSPAQEANLAEQQIKQCIDIINQHDFIITRPFTSVFDQDFLNYLHHIFEVYHGLLDHQTHEWFVRAPIVVQQALSQLNISVHRCENLRTNRPRFVCTWFGQPKELTLDQDLMKQHGKLNIEFGGVYLNYVEIGKTLLEMAQDNDEYIGSDAFKPFQHYSSDFVVYFYATSTADSDQELKLVNAYYQQHHDYFKSLGVESKDHVMALPLRYKVAQLSYQDTDAVINQIKQHQYVAKVELK
jgi:hypothetical protein